MVIRKRTPLIQRLIILHLGLLPVSKKESSQENSDHHDDASKDDENNMQGDFDETASLEELCEHILYYFDYRMHSSQFGLKMDSESNCWRDEICDTYGDTGGADCTVNEDAVKFSGLCRALYSLPKSLQRSLPGNTANESKKDKFASSYTSSTPKQIATLSTSCLVFVCLEQGRDDIIAVVEIPRTAETKNRRLSPDGNFKARGKTKKNEMENDNKSNLGANPKAIENIFKKCHMLFQLTRGGSIHSRLLKVDESTLSLIVTNEKEMLNEMLQKSVAPFRARRMSLVTSTQPTRNLPTTMRRFSNQSDPSDTAAEPKHVTHHEQQNIGINLPYPGMDRVYFYRRNIRKLSQSMGRNSYLSRNTDTTESEEGNKLSQYQALLGNLLDVLPVTNLRDDLRRYYNDVITQLMYDHQNNVCVGRSLVDLLPKPLPMFGSRLKTLQYLPTAPSPYEMLVVSKMVRSLLQLNDAYDPKGRSRKVFRKEISNSIFAISTFFNGRHIFTHRSSKRDSSLRHSIDWPQISSLPSAFASKTKSHLRARSIDIPVETTFLLFEHLSRSPQYCEKMSRRSRSNTVDEIFLNNSESILDPLSFGNDFSDLKKSLKSEKSHTPPPQSTFSRKNSSQTKGKFVEPPPASKVSTAEILDSVFVPIFGVVWLPKVYLHDHQGNNEAFEARAFMYNFGDFSFIFYIEDIFDLHDSFEKSTDDPAAKMLDIKKYTSFRNVRTESGNDIGELLGDIGVYVSSLLSELQLYQQNVSKKTISLTKYKENCLDFLKKSPLEKAGADIVFVDRNEHNLIILTERTASDLGKSDSTKNNENKFKNPFDISEKMGQNGHNYNEKKGFARSSNIHMLYNENIDCRHLLASHFPRDVMLSFDDMFNEIQRLRSAEYDNSDNIFTKERIIELCTFSPQGWMYARAHNERELYILFDANIHVTLADVQKAATLIRSNIFNDSLL